MSTYKVMWITANTTVEAAVIEIVTFSPVRFEKIPVMLYCDQRILASVLNLVYGFPYYSSY